MSNRILKRKVLRIQVRFVFRQEKKSGRIQMF